MANPAVLALRDPGAAKERPLPLRTYSESETAPLAIEMPRVNARPRSRHQSMSANLARLTVPSDNRQDVSELAESQGCVSGLGISTGDLTPPSTPGKSGIVEDEDDESAPEVLDYDFSRIDYEIDRARMLGSGLWSDVFIAEPTDTRPNLASPSMLTPPVTPQKASQSSRPSLYAIKLPTRPDAIEVFHQEAKTLSQIHRHPSSTSHVVPFHGLDPRSTALVFTALPSGSLQDLTNRLSHLTELCRHFELVTHFPSLAADLVAGLDFLHNTAHIVHADIKPANILLSPAPTPRNPTRLTARYADFSASFPASAPPSKNSPGSAAAGAGTWTYLAPELLRYPPPPPSPSSDVWSLGLTLLSLIILGSPYAAAAGGNLFRLREAIKAGDPLGFAVMEPVMRKRVQACQEFVDCCRLAVQKDAGRRVEVGAWRAWVGRVGWER